MRREELDLALDWAAAEGWNPGLSDADCFYTAGPEGFFLCESQGQPLGFISAVAYGDHFGFIGLFVVRPDHRGGRVGVALGRTALAHLADRNIGLDGVENKVHNYEAFGFHLAHRNIRFEGSARPCATSGQAVELGSVPFDQVLGYDARHFPAPRAAFLNHWINQPRAKALGVLRRERLAGYGVIRPCRRGSKIGPLFADDLETAGLLLQDLIAGLPEGSPFYLDVPETNADALALAAEYAMRPVFKTARMYNREAPALPIKEIFGITSFELG